MSPSNTQTATTVHPVGASTQGQVQVEIFAQVDETEVPADAIIVTVRKGRNPTGPLHTAIKEAVGEHFHAALKKNRKDLSEIGSIVVLADAHQPLPPFRSVLFVERSGIARTMERAFSQADEYGFSTVVLPVMAFLDNPRDADDVRWMREFQDELSLVLESAEFRNLKTVKVVHPSGPGEYGSSRRRAEMLAALQARQRAAGPEHGVGASVSIESAPSERGPAITGAVASVEVTPGAVQERIPLPAGRKYKCPLLHAALFAGDISDKMIPSDAVLATMPVNASPTSVAVTTMIARHAGDTFHRQIPRQLPDGDCYLVSGLPNPAYSFRDVAFMGCDGTKQVAEYVKQMLRFADTVGLKRVTIPLANFLQTTKVTDVAMGGLIDQFNAGIQAFMREGWDSLEMIYVVVTLG